MKGKKGCDSQRVYVPGPQPQLLVEDLRLRGLSACSNDNNSVFTMVVVACQSFMEGQITRCHARLKDVSSRSLPQVSAQLYLRLEAEMLCSIWNVDISFLVCIAMERQCKVDRAFVVLTLEPEI